MIKYNMKLMAVIQKVYIILLYTKGEQKQILVNFHDYLNFILCHPTHERT